MTTDDLTFDDAPAVPKQAAERNGAHQPEEMPRYRRTQPAATAGRPLPADVDAEEALVSTLFVDAAEVLQVCRAAGLTESSFTSQEMRAVFAQAADLAAAGQPVDTVTVALGLKGRLQGVNVYALVARLETSTATTAQAAGLIRKVRDAELLRAIHMAHLRGMEDVFGHTGDVAELLEAQQARLRKLADGAKGQSDIMGRAYRASRRVPRPDPVFTVADIPICTRGNITTIYGPPKGGKSAWLAAFLASTMLPGTSTLDTLGVRGPNYDKLAVLHFDTEQSTYDWQQFIGTVMRRAGMAPDAEPPPWLMSFTLTGMESAAADKFVHAALALARKLHKGIHSVFIDGTADLVSSPNDEEASNALVARLHGAAIEYDTSIINILHLNPAAKDKVDKGRGHLGSQLERKSESNLTLKKDGETTVVVAEGRQRGRPIPADKSPAFKWSDERAMHVSTTAPEGAATPSARDGSNRGREPKYNFSDFRLVFPAKDQPGKPVAELARASRQNVPMSENQFYNVVKRFAEEGHIVSYQEKGRALWRMAF